MGRVFLPQEIQLKYNIGNYNDEKFNEAIKEKYI